MTDRRSFLIAVAALTPLRSMAQAPIPDPKPIPRDWPSVTVATDALFAGDVVFYPVGKLASEPKRQLKTRVIALATRWRRNRDPKALIDLYEAYLTRLAEGLTPVGHLVNLLGPPDTPELYSGRGDVHYFISNGSGLFLEADRNQRLKGRRMS